MKTSKKLLLGLAYLFVFGFGLSMLSRHALAATPDNKYLSACVANIISPDVASRSDNQLQAKLCKVDSNSGFVVNMYGGLEVGVDLKQATYKGATTLDSITSNGVTLQVPRFILLLDSTGQNPLFSGDLSSKNLACGTITHSSLVGNTEDQFSGIKEPYIVYTASGVDPSCNNTTFLVTLNTDGTLQLLAIANNTVQNGNFIYAANINKPVQGANAVTGTNNTNNGGDDTSKCVAAGHTSLEWILCPITTSISKFVDQYINVVQDQLNFNINTYLPDSNNPSNGQVKEAWTVVKDVVSALLVVVLLVMVISQAMGGGPFEAYTVRKMLPRVVVAVILMQVSWYLCRYLIQLADYTGEGVRQLLLAPFGSNGNMDLDSLLHHANPAWALGTNVAVFTAFLIFVLAASEFILPILALVAFTVLMAVLVGLASLLFRNILIVMLVIFSPLALLVWVFPGQAMQGYWKKWSDNFTKLLLLFPLMMALIYSGRIVAWIAGNLGIPGFLDYAMVLVGFFGPLFFLPKAFKWGGAWMAAASSAIASNKGISKVRDYGGKEIRDMVNRKSGEMSKYNPNDEAFTGKGQFRLPNSKFIPKSLRGQQMAVIPTGGRGMSRIKSGSVMPTARGRALTTQKYSKWKEDRDAERRAYVNAQYEAGERGDFDGYVYRWNSDKGQFEKRKYEKGETGPGPAKAALENAMVHPDVRERKTAMEKYMETSSWIEAENDAIEVDPNHPVGAQREYNRQLIDYLDKTYGLDTLQQSENGGYLVRPFQLPEWISVQDNNPDFWGRVSGKRTDLTPPVLQASYPKYISAEEASQSPEMAEARGKALRTIESYGMTEADWQAKAGKRLSHADRTAYSIDQSYVSAGNLASQAQGFLQEAARSNSSDVSLKLANLLGGIARGGPGAAGSLVNMGGGEGSDLMQEWDKALSHIKTPDGRTIRFVDYIDAARTGNVSNIPRLPGTPAAPATESESSGRDDGIGTSTSSSSSGVSSGRNTTSPQPNTTFVNQGEGTGTLVIHPPQPQVVQLQPGEGVSPGGVVLTRGAQDELIESMRHEFRDLKRMGVRNQEQQQRLEEIQSAHPDWQDDNENENA